MARKNHEALTALEKLIGEPITFGLYIQSIRETEDLTQGEFAEKLGISIQHLSNVENGRKHVSIERAEAWAKALRAGLDGYVLPVKKGS
jgi:transcriptional regulator with XRE-family HTH domain